MKFSIMKTKKVILSFMLAIVACVSAFAEDTPFEDTPYEAKVKDICIKYYCYCKYGYNGGLDMGDIWTLNLYGYKEATMLMLLEYSMKTDAKRGGQWTQSFKKELKDAESLMTDADFQKIFLESTYGKALTIVKEQLDAKFTKDEFESQAQFEARARKDAAKEFDRLCGKLVGNMNSTLNIVITPESYDAEKSMYKVNVTESAKFSDEVGLTNKYEKWIKMPSNVARVYKGDSINLESVMSVVWEMDNDGILVGKVEYKDEQGNMKEYVPGHQGTKPLVFMYDKYKEKKPLLPGHVWAAANFKNYYPEYAKKLSSLIEEYNNKIADDKYFDSHRADNYLFKQKNYSLGNVDSNDEPLLQQALAEQELEIKTNYNSKVAQMKEDCRKKNPDKFISIYASEHPEFADKVASLDADYRCYNYDYNKLAFYVIDGIVPQVKKCYDKYNDLFNNDDEFYSFYSDAYKFNKEVESRKDIRNIYRYTISKLENEEKLSFKGAKESKSKDMQILISNIDKCKIVDTWYSSILDLCFKSDVKMQNEYSKVGSIFGSRKVFFESYISSSYKTDLKNAKKSK